MEITVKHIRDESIGDFSGEHMRVEIGGTVYEMAQIRPGDLASAQTWMRDKAMSAFLDSTQRLRMLEGERAKGLATIVMTPFPLTQVIDDALGRLYLLHLSLKAAGSKLTWEQVQNDIPIEIIQDLTRILLWVSGFGDPDEETKETDKPDPTTPTDMSGPSNGPG